MQLAYLDFDRSEDADGQGTLDAMASVDAKRLPSLLAEIEAVMGWACRAFGAPAPLEEGGVWDYALEAADGEDAPLEVAVDLRAGRVLLASGGRSRVTVTFTVTGSEEFCDALVTEFPAQEG